MKQASFPAQPAVKRSRFPGRRGWFYIACGVYLLATCVALGPVLFSGQSLVLSHWGEDLSRQFLGWRAFGFGQLNQGHLALWNPYLFCGTPFLGGFQSALLYPPNWLYLILPLGVAVNVGIALHVFLAGLWTYCLVSHRRLNPIASILAGMIYMFGGAYFLHIYAGHLTNLCTMVWAPLIFLSIDRLTSEQGWGGAWVGSIAVAMQVLAGHPQYVFYTAIIVGIYALARLRHAPRPWRAAAGCLLIYGVGAALSSAQLLTGIQATLESARRTLSESQAGRYSFAPENLLTAITPGIFGDVVGLPYWGRWLLWEESIYIGVAAAALAVYGMGRGAGAARRGAIAGALAALLLALGEYTPLFRILYHVPGFASFRGLSKFIFLMLMFLALLAAVGFDRLLKSERPWRIAPAAAIALGLLALVAAALVHGSADSPDRWWCRSVRQLDWPANERLTPKIPPPQVAAQFAHQAAGQLAWCGALFLLVAALWWAIRYWRPIAYGLPLLACIELIVFAARHTDSFPIERVGMIADGWQQTLGEFNPQARIMSVAQSFMLLDEGHDIWGNDPMVMGRYSHFIARSQEQPGELRPVFNHMDSPMLRLTRLEAYFHEDGSEHRVPRRPLARAQLMSQFEIIPDASKRLERLASPNFDPTHSVILETSPDPAPAAGPVDGHVELNDLSTDHVEVRASLPRPAILLITDTYSTGWHVRPLEGAAGQTYRILPADQAFRGIPLAAGEHHFLLEYRPAAWVIGKWISIVAIAGYLGVGIWKLTRRPPLAASRIESRSP